MVGCDIEKYGNIGLEFGHPVELKTAEFQYVIIITVFSYLQCQTISHIACQTNVQSAVFQNMINQHGSSGLAVTTGDAYHFCIGISTSKFNF